MSQRARDALVYARDALVYARAARLRAAKRSGPLPGATSH